MTSTTLLNLLVISYLAFATPFWAVPVLAVTIHTSSNVTSAGVSTIFTNRRGAGKPGIAWSSGNDPAIKNFKTWKVDKYYTWSPWCVDYADSVGMECCPMLWGPQQITDFTNLVKPGYANCALGFNEPDLPSQANLSPNQAAQLWLQYLNPLKDRGYYLVSPACSNAPSGKTWMQSFVNNCMSCQIDAVALHWYGTDAQAFIGYITDMHYTFNKPIWVTEFACQNFNGGPQCTRDQVFNFMSTVTAWMDNATFVEKYFAFGATHDMSNVNPANQLLGDNGFPTELGYLYIGSRDGDLPNSSRHSRNIIYSFLAWTLILHFFI